MSGEFGFTNKMEEEIERRIKIMEDPSYDPGQPLNKQDFILAILVGLLCVVGLIWGIS